MLSFAQPVVTASIVVQHLIENNKILKLQCPQCACDRQCYPKLHEGFASFLNMHRIPLCSFRDEHFERYVSVNPRIDRHPNVKYFANFDCLNVVIPVFADDAKQENMLYYGFSSGSYTIGVAYYNIVAGKWRLSYTHSPESDITLQHVIGLIFAVVCERG